MADEEKVIQQREPEADHDEVEIDDGDSQQEAGFSAPAEDVVPPAEPILPPDWMKNLLEPQQERSPERGSSPKEDQSAPPKDEETILGEAEIRRIDQIVEQRLANVRAENEALKQQLGRFVGRDVSREVKATIGDVYRNHYANTFQNDSEFRTRPEVASLADGIIQNWVQLGFVQAKETGDTGMLERAREPIFGQLALAIAKVVAGSGPPKGPVVPKGADVESTATGAKTKPAPARGPLAGLSKEDREAALAAGVTEDRIKKAMETRRKYGAL